MNHDNSQQHDHTDRAWLESAITVPSKSYSIDSSEWIYDLESLTKDLDQFLTKGVIHHAKYMASYCRNLGETLITVTNEKVEAEKKLEQIKNICTANNWGINL